MKRFAVIGIGHFGGTVARALFESGVEVLAVDFNKEIVQTAAEFSTQAIFANATDKKTLSAIGLDEVDAAIVSLGERLDVITLTALHLKELGVPYIAVKALSDDHAKILRAIGVNEIIHPEEEAALRLATRLSLNNVIDFLPLLAGYSVVSMQATPSVIGKKVNEIETQNIQIVAIQHKNSPRPALIPNDEEIIRDDDVLILIGENQEIIGFTENYCREN